MPTLVSVYDLVSDTSNVVRSLKARGFDDLTTYAPAPFEELEQAEDPRPSKVRIFTLLGGLAGVVTGFGIQIWMSMDWPIKIAGKNFAAIPPMWIIGFELTILFGGILTILGLVGLGGLYPRPLDEHYSPRFSAEEFGVVVKCDERDVAEVEALMRGNNAKEVTLHA
jgi:molybdopterin-containing oxidoreductase family membrane subunit